MTLTPNGIAVLERLWLYHLLAAIGMARHGIEGVFAMTGSRHEGQHKSDIDGNAWASAWSPAGFVSLDADHEILDPDGGNPDLSSVVPGKLRPLFERALADVHGRANAVLWVDERGLHMRGDTDRFELLTLPLERNFADGERLDEFFGLQATDVVLARRLLALAVSGSELDEQTIAEVLGMDGRRLLSRQFDANAGAEMMAPLGVKWSDPKGTAKRHFESRQDG